jgi:surface antigen
MKKASQAAFAAFIALAFVPIPSPADPPPWAPAHGWRKKNDPNYVGYTGKKWGKDYGVLDGRCNSAAVGAVLGGAVGGAIGSQVGRGEDRPVAIVIGTVLGAVIGSKIGADIDNGDRGCFGHALELAGERKTVRWTNAATGVSYQLTPTRNVGSQANPCREFTAVAEKGSGKKNKGKKAAQGETIKGVGCRRGDGAWEIKL